MISTLQNRCFNWKSQRWIWWHTTDTLLSKSSTPLLLYSHSTLTPQLFERSCGVVLYSTLTPLPLQLWRESGVGVEWKWSGSRVRVEWRTTPQLLSKMLWSESGLGVKWKWSGSGVRLRVEWRTLKEVCPLCATIDVRYSMLVCMSVTLFVGVATGNT